MARASVTRTGAKALARWAGVSALLFPPAGAAARDVVDLRPQTQPGQEGVGEQRQAVSPRRSCHSY